VNRIRLPLQVGTSALGHAAAGALTIVPGAWAAFALMYRLRAGAAPGALLFLGPLGAYVAVYGLLELRRAWGTRASDLTLDLEGFAVEGGRHDGLRLRWSEIDPERSRAETQTEVRLTLGKIVGDVLFLVLGLILSDNLELAPEERVPLRRLFVVTRDGREHLLAEAVHPAEQASVDALVGTIRARSKPAGAERAPTPPNVLACVHCGAALTPVDSETVGCGYCGAHNAVPAELRARIRAVIEVAASKQGLARALGELLDQPGAGAATTALVLAILASVVTWAAATFVLVLANLADLDAFDTTLMLLSGIALSGVFFLWARAGLARRRALHLVTAAYGAKPPRDARGGWTCRQCGGALPASTHLVQGCAYCGVDNVLGVDLRTEASAGRKERASIEQVLAGARTERGRFAVLAIGGAVVATIAGGLGNVQLESAKKMRQLRAACTKEDAIACRKLGVAYDHGIDTGKDPAKACGVFEKACDLEDAESCDRLASCFIIGIDRPSDVGRGERLRRRACKLGYEPACKALEE